MERYSEVIGLPVICAEDGKKVGSVKDILFSPKERKVLAILLELESYQIIRRAVMLDHILNLGGDAVIINGSECVKELKKLENLDTFKNKGIIKGLRIYTKSGDDLGVVKDILFDYKTGYIEGVEISDGLVQDIMQGRRILPFIGKVEFSDESILVDRDAAEEMTSTGGGLKKKLLT